MFTPKNILVPTDFTEDSDRALKEAIDIAASSGGRVYLLHVDPYTSAIVGGETYAAIWEVMDVVEKSDEQKARQRMMEEIKKVASQTEVEIEIDERHGVTFEQILAYMEEKRIDLVVIEPHARKGMVKSLLGGVTDKLLKEAACPMLVLPAIV